MNEAIAAFKDEMTSWRHHLHMNPEIAFQEKDTADFVAAKLESFGIEVHRGLGGTGVVGIIRGRDEAAGRAIGLRADMDALPMDEETNLAWASTREGAMHACGHDGHTTMLLGAAKYLAETRDFAGTVYCIFQPAEEGGNGGARRMIEDGLFEQFPMQSVWGMHNWPGLGVGEAVSHPGVAMAGADIFILRLEGKGGHAAMPHQSHDPVLAAGLVIVALQSLVSRQLDPFDQAVVSLTRLDGGSAYNVIPATVEIGGTLRTMKAETRRFMLERIEQVAGSVAASNNCKVTMELRPGYPPTTNHAAEAAIAGSALEDVLGSGAVRHDQTPVMGAEDFSYMLEQCPGAYIWLGAGEDAEKLHSPHFDFNDALLVPGASYWARLTETLLNP